MHDSLPGELPGGRRFARLIGGALVAAGVVLGMILLLHPSQEARADAGEFGIMLRAGTQDQPIRVDRLSPGSWSDGRRLSLRWEPANNRPIKYRIRCGEVQESTAGMAELVQVRVSTGSPRPGETVWEGPLLSLQVTAWNRNSPAPPPSWPQVYVVHFKLAEEAGNRYQGARITFGLAVDATQASNPGW